MGQRLNIEIIKSGKTLANAYYHWSAYSKSAAELASIIIKNVDNVNGESDLVKAIRLLELTGAGLSGRELEYAKTVDELKDVAFKECMDRNEGLIGISNNEINQTRIWQEYALYIYLDEERIGYKVFYQERRWDYERDSGGEDGFIAFDELEIYDVNFDDIRFKDVNKFVDFVKEQQWTPFRTYMDSWDVFRFIY